jgi:hypothetical protein
MPPVHAITEFLFPAPAERSTLAIVRWWESRRLPFNLIVGGTGLFTLALVNLIGWLPPGPHVTGPPLALVAVYGLLANGCYLLGPAVEVLVEKIWGRSMLPIGPALYRMGLTFSVGLTLFPVLIFLIGWVYRIVGVFL